MPYTFTWGDIEKLCQSLGMARVGRTKTWRGVGADGKFRQTYIHSHGKKSPVAKGTASAIANQLHFSTVEEMHRYLKKL